MDAFMYIPPALHTPSVEPDDLCASLGALHLQQPETPPDSPPTPPAPLAAAAPPAAAPHGCAYMQALQAPGDCATTAGAYLEAIFTHRELFAAWPSAHSDCARAFSDLAEALDGRPPRADRDGDGEAAAAFRYEAWVLAAAL